MENRRKKKYLLLDWTVSVINTLLISYLLFLILLIFKIIDRSLYITVCLIWVKRWIHTREMLGSNPSSIYVKAYHYVHCMPRLFLCTIYIFTKIKIIWKKIWMVHFSVFVSRLICWGNCYSFERFARHIHGDIFIRPA